MVRQLSLKNHLSNREIKILRLAQTIADPQQVRKILIAIFGSRLSYKITGTVLVIRFQIKNRCPLI